MNPPDDLIRLQREYADRERRLAGSDIYSPFNPAALFTLQQRQREVLRLLRLQGFYPLEGRSILEVGCGEGGVLLEYLAYGAAPARLHGVDLLPARLREAHRILPHLPLVCADGRFLPYPADYFDMVLQYTVYSSILDFEVKQRMSAEIVRVLKPDGMILWYDFWWNPTNPHTKGIRPAEIRRLFPECEYEFHKITLAPPFARRLVVLSWALALLLEMLKVFNSHYLVAIRPKK